MKRSKMLKLVLMSAALSGCSDNDTVTLESQARVFDSVERCASLGRDTGEMTSADCRQSFDSAKNSHQQDAPRFLSKEACEKEFGQDGCAVGHTQTSSGPAWMPMLAGMMVGSLMSGGRQQFVSQPLYGAPNTRHCPDGRQVALQESCSSGRGYYGSGYGGSYRTANDSTPIRSDALSRTALSESQVESMKKTAVQQNPALAGRPTTTSRGGFGARASSASSSSSFGG